MGRENRRSAKAIFKRYLKRLAQVASHGDATEQSFYSTLSDMLAEFASHTGHSDTQVTELPKPTEAGNPDFRVWDGQSHIVGYLEAKAPTERLLDNIEQTDQLRRYRQTFPNLILTNFLEFRLYRNGRQVAHALIGRPVALEVGQPPPLENADQLEELLSMFFDFSLPAVTTPEGLAEELAKRTRFLRDVVAAELEAERSNPGPLTGFFKAFRKFLIGTLDRGEFADLYAQTITYALFIARTRATSPFTRRAAFDNIPPTIGILRDLFRFISLADPPEQIAWCADDVAAVLAAADLPAILRKSPGGPGEAITYFYEPFLARYDPQERERRGVYYTPPEVVGFIVRSLHEVLKTHFDKADGLASEDVTLLDPAAGTMTFVARAAEEAVRQFVQAYGEGARKDFIRKHVLENFYAFELMMAPYAIGHLRMALALEELGHRLTEKERIPFYLTNTLEMEELEQSSLPGLSALAEESHLAGEVKKEIPILVILGNPPYSGHSANRGKWISQQIETYKTVDGQPLREKNPKWLQDDYVKFLRFAQWKIGQAGRGVVGMITNHSYLDNPTFRGMRQSLMRTFDEIYVLDLHGSALKREKAPDGGPDENVFDIRQGVAIAFFIKRGKGKKTPATLHHAELWGTRKEKYDWLDAHDLENTPWTEVQPGAKLYLFVPLERTQLTQYEAYPCVREIFPLHGVGMTTARDRFVIDFQREDVVNRMRLFKNSKATDDELHASFRVPRKKGWSIRRAWQMLNAVPDSNLPDLVVPVAYRPMDVRWIIYHDAVVWRTVKRVMRHMLAGENLALITPKQHKGDFGALVSTHVVAHKAVASYEINYVLPLYLYPGDEEDLFSRHDVSERRPNLEPRLVAALTEAYGREPSPEEIFHYVYAVLHAPTYREKYGEFLRYDFPRIPFTADVDLFARMAHLGQRLVELHLLRSPELDPPIARFEGKGESRVGKGRKAGVRYDPLTRRVHINPEKYFVPVPPEVWEYRIGGYQVCEKWLKDRKERKLSVEEVKTYCRMVTALAKTIEIQAEIDEAYAGVEAQTVPLPPR